MIFKKFKWQMVCQALITIFIFSNSPVFGGQAVTKGMTFPDFQVMSAGTDEVQEYLGLKSAEPFTLSDIPSKLVLVEFYSIYCAICQKQAPDNNKLFKYIQGDQNLSRDLKMIGIGLGNKPFEVKYFKEAHSVRFPLFPDADKSILKKTGIQATPVMVLMQPDGKVLIAHYGRINDLEGFFQEIKKIHSMP